MNEGRVMWFNRMPGFGFIEAHEGETDVFVYISLINRADLLTLDERQSL